MRHSLAIKNLSIALEALSRIPNSSSLSMRIEDLLGDLLTKEERNVENPVKPYNAPQQSPVEEIPF
jgi:hypothetical protein